MIALLDLRNWLLCNLILPWDMSGRSKKEKYSSGSISFGGWSPGVHLLAKPELHADVAAVELLKQLKSLAKILTKCLLKLLAMQPQQPSHRWAATSAGDNKLSLQQRATRAQSSRQLCYCMSWGSRSFHRCQRCANMDSAGHSFLALAKLFMRAWFGGLRASLTLHSSLMLSSLISSHIYKDIHAWF